MPIFRNVGYKGLRKTIQENTSVYPISRREMIGLCLSSFGCQCSHHPHVWAAIPVTWDGNVPQSDTVSAARKRRDIQGAITAN